MTNPKRYYPPFEKCFYCGNPIKNKEHFELTKNKVKSQIYLCQSCYEYLEIEGK